MAGEMVEFERAQMLDVRREQVNEQVVPTCHMISGPHAAEAAKLIEEAVDGFALLLRHLDHQHRFDLDAERSGIDVGMGTAKQAS